jgi:hypothetical protein
LNFKKNFLKENFLEKSLEKLLLSRLSPNPSLCLSEGYASQITCQLVSLAQASFFASLEKQSLLLFSFLKIRESDSKNEKML